MGRGVGEKVRNQPVSVRRSVFANVETGLQAVLATPAAKRPCCLDSEAGTLVLNGGSTLRYHL